VSSVKACGLCWRLEARCWTLENVGTHSALACALRHSFGPLFLPGKCIRLGGQALRFSGQAEPISQAPLAGDLGALSFPAKHDGGAGEDCP